MTEKNLINEIDDMKSLSEEDFAFANNGDCEDIAENEVCDNSQQAVNLGVETSENSQEEAESEEAKSDTDVEKDGDELSRGKLIVKKKGIPTRKLCGMAVLTALAVVLSCTIHIPYFGASFLEYSPSDVPVLIASFLVKNASVSIAVV